MSDDLLEQLEQTDAPTTRRGLSTGSWVLLAGVVVAVIVIGVALLRQQQAQPTSGLAPDFTITTFDGQEFRLSEQRGKIVVINFWASWCDPCKEEMPSLGDLAKVLEKRDDIVLLTVSVDEDPKVARDTLAVLLASETIPFPVLMDPEMKVVNEKYGTRLYPETWIIDPEGYVRLRFDGAEDWSHAIAIEAIESVARGRGCVVEFREGRALAPHGKLCESD